MFDLKVHHKNPKTGRVERSTPYKLRVSPQGKIYTRDGIDYYESGELVNKPVVKKQEEVKPQESQKTLGQTMGQAIFGKKELEKVKA